MKQIQLKKGVKMLNPTGREILLDYWAQLQSIMRTPLDMNQGAQIDEIRKSIRIIDALDKAGEEGETLELEDSDFEYMVDRVNKARFAFADPALVQFVDDVTKPEESES